MDTEKMRRRRKPRWFEKYLPFIARSPEKRLEWLRSVFRRKVLSREEITPYIRLLLDVEEEDLEHLRDLFLPLDKEVVDVMLHAADIDDLPKLLGLIPHPSVKQAVIALAKAPPSYEEAPNLLLDRVFKAVHDRSEGLLEEAAASLLRSGEVPPHFPAAYERFQEILADQRILTSLYPKAR